MANYADQLAEKQLRDGTASSQVITHYLKATTERERLERERLAYENLKLQAQIAEIESKQNTEQMMAEVLKAIRLYAGVDDDDEE